MSFTWQVPKRTATERRRYRRFPVRQPVTVKLEVPFVLDSLTEKHTVQTGTSRDVSGNGIFVWLRDRISLGTTVQIAMVAPKEIIPEGNVDLFCTGSVVRVEYEYNKVGMAIAFNRIDTAHSSVSLE